MFKPIHKAVENAITFVKDNAKIVAMIVGLGAGAYFADKYMDKANASNIQIENYGSISNGQFFYDVPHDFAHMQNRADANEMFDVYDTDYYYDFWNNGLEVYFEPYGTRLGVNALPKNSPGGVAKLSVRGYLSGYVRNTLNVRVTNSSGLEHRRVIAYDVNNPSVKHNIPKDGFTYPVFDLVKLNMSAGEYAAWVFETPANVEGDCASSSGVGILDGVFDYWDLAVLGGEWLEHTNEGDNYLWGDWDYNGDNNFYDFSIGAGNWMVSE